MSAEPSPLVGRASVLSAIGRGAREGNGAVLVGASGSGGSRLLADAFSATRRAGLRAVRLQPASTEGGRLTALLTSLDRAGIEDGPAGGAGGELQVLFLDDAHLIDEEAGSFLMRLARRGTAVVANATGSAGMPAALRRLVEEGRASAVELTPLTRDEVAELAGILLGDPVDGELALELTSSSGGRPGTLTEIIDAGVGSRAIAHADGLWRLVRPLPVGRSVRAAVLDGFTALPPEQRGWIAAVAQAGGLADDLARRIAADSVIQAVADAGWTERDEDRGATRLASQPMGTAVLGSLDPRARVAVLRRLVAVAEAAGRPLDVPERIALTLWRIDLGDRTDPAEARALAHLTGANLAAKEALLRAAVGGGVPADAELAEHLRRTRRPAEALELIDVALPAAVTDDERVELVRVRAMTTGVVERRSADALAALDASIAESGPHPDLLAARAAMLLLEGRPAETARAATAVLAAAKPSRFATAFGLLQLALAQRALGDLSSSRGTAARLAARDDVDEAFVDGAALATWLPWELTVATGAETNDVEAALVAAHAIVPGDQCAVRRPPLSYTLASVRLLRADPGAAVRLLRDADGGSGPWREGWQPRILAELAIAAALSGSLDDAAGTLDRLGRIACPPVQRARVDLATAQVAHAAGDAGSARSLAAVAADRGRAAGLALDAFDATFAGIRYGDDSAPARLLALGDRPTGAGREAQRGYARALITTDPAALHLAAADLWNAGLRLFAIEGATRAAALGSTPAATQLVAWLARAPTLRLPDVGDRHSAGLTAREREVALLAARGASDRAIALELDITLRTAQTHLGRALGKLGIHRRTELRGLVIEP